MHLELTCELLFLNYYCNHYLKKVLYKLHFCENSNRTNKLLYYYLHD
jgi:hypothetical protein